MNSNAWGQAKGAQRPERVSHNENHRDNIEAECRKERAEEGISAKKHAYLSPMS